MVTIWTRIVFAAMLVFICIALVFQLLLEWSWCTHVTSLFIAFAFGSYFIGPSISPPPGGPSTGANEWTLVVHVCTGTPLALIMSFVCTPFSNVELGLFALYIGACWTHSLMASGHIKKM